MFDGLFRKWGLCGAAILSVANLVQADPPEVLPPPLPPATTAIPDDLRIRLERLEKLNERLEKQNERLEQQNNNLMERLQRVESPMMPPITPAGLGEGPPSISRDDVKKVVADYVKDQEDRRRREEEERKAAAAAAGFTVGNGSAVSATFDKGLRFSSADSAFKVHVGGRTQVDYVGYTASQEIQFGPGGVGNIRDGVNFRRARLEMDGTIYEVIDFFAEYEFLGNTYNVNPGTPNAPNNIENTPGPTDLWATLTHIPILGNFRVGNMKPPIGFEHLTSSRWLNFMERSFAFDAFIGGTNNGFIPGMQIFNWSENERATWALGVFKNNQTVLGWNVGDGELDVTGRITGLPIYEDNGRCLVHLGIGASHRALDEGVARLRARTLLRNGPFTLQTVLADITVAGNSQTLVVPEFAMVMGPWTVQAEYFGSYVDQAFLPGTAGPRRGYFQQSAYGEVLYFLTGESRPYNKKGGSGAAFDRVIPFRNYFFVPGSGGNILSSGAWQVGARYSWIDFNNNGFNAGTLHDFTLGLNWFLNPNMKFQWNYDLAFRDNPLSPTDGPIHGFGMRMAYDF